MCPLWSKPHIPLNSNILSLLDTQHKFELLWKVWSSSVCHSSQSHILSLKFFLTYASRKVLVQILSSAKPTMAIHFPPHTLTTFQLFFSATSDFVTFCTFKHHMVTFCFVYLSLLDLWTPWKYQFHLIFYLTYHLCFLSQSLGCVWPLISKLVMKYNYNWISH